MLLILILLFFFPPVLFSAGHPAENTGRSWNQNVRYEIDATLDTTARQLSVELTLRYANNSPDTLSQLIIQIPSNAYADTSNTAVREMQRLNSSENVRFEVRPRNTLRIQMLQFLSIGEEHEFPMQAFDFSDTILRLPLPASLLPADTLIIRMNYSQDLERLFDRKKPEKLHIDFDDWLPKVSVYDTAGWHIEPFHLMMQQSDVFTEFAEYEVRLRVPQNFFVVASGEPVRADSMLFRFRADTALSGDSFTAWQDSLRAGMHSEFEQNAFKILRYTASRALNFTWSAATNLVGYRMESLVPVNFFARGTDEGRELAIELFSEIDSVLSFMQQQFGTFPFDSLTIIQAANGSYNHPGLIMLHDADGLSLVSSLTSAWIPATVGLNGLNDGWLHRGLALYLAKRYNEQRYGKAGYDKAKVREDMNFFMRRYPLPSLDEMIKSMTRLYLNSGKDERIAQPIHSYSDPMSAMANMYLKADLFFEMLEYVIGEESMRRTLSRFFAQNKHRHVGASHLQESAEAAYGQELSWFFEQWLYRTPRVDYSKGTVRSYQREDKKWVSEIELKREGDGIMPVEVELVLPSGKTVRERWDGKAKQHTLIVLTDEKPKDIRVDPEDSILDENRLNNDRLRIEFKPDLPFLKYYYIPNDRYLVLWKPSAAYNTIDGLKLGLRSRGSYQAVFNQLTADIEVGLKSGSVDGVLGYSHPIRRRSMLNRYNLLARKKEGRYELRAELSFSFSKGIIAGSSKSLRFGISHTGITDTKYLSRPILVTDAEKTIEEWENIGIGSVYGEFVHKTSSPATGSTLRLHAEAARTDAGDFFGLLQFRQRISRAYGWLLGGIALNAGHIVSQKRVPSQTAFFPGDASPLRRFREGIMMTGSDWKSSSRRFTEGGARLHGYAGKMTSLNSYLSLNLELAAKVTLLGLRPFAFYDAGLVREQDSSAYTTLRNAGLGLRVPRISTPFFGGAVSLFEGISLRLYVPVYVSNPWPGEKKMRWRWFVAFGKEF